MRADLLAYDGLAKTECRRKVGVIGAMKELGAFTESEHHALAPLIDSIGFSCLFLIGEETLAIKEKLLSNDSVIFHADISDAVRCNRCSDKTRRFPVYQRIAFKQAE